MSGESFLDRLVRIARQKLVASAERLDDPGEAIDAVIAQHLDLINELRADVAMVATAQKRLERLIEEMQHKCAVHVDGARQAKGRNALSLARMEMRRAMHAERALLEAQRHLEDVRAQRDEVERLLEELRGQYDVLRVRRASADAIASSARAVSRGHEAMSALGPEGEAKQAQLNRVHETLAQLRSRADALTELRQSGVLDAVGAAEFDSRSSITDADVDDRLKEME